jgi:hypothetical protein
MNQPNAFLGNPYQHGSKHPQPTPPVSRVQEPRGTYTLPRSVPTLTVYADGNANLNNEAAGLLAPHGTGVELHEPAPHRTNAGNPRRPNLWSIGTGSACKLLPRADRVARRFRVGKVAPPPGRYLLTPLADQEHRFTLVPM